MKRFGNFISKNKYLVIMISVLLLVISFICSSLTKINYDILVYLPKDIETIKGQNILTDDFNMGSYSIAVIDNMSNKDILKLEKKIKKVDGVANVASLYDAIGTTIPVEMLPSEIVEKMHNKNTDLMLITFSDSTSSNKTIEAVSEIRDITDDKTQLSGMSSMVLDTMQLSEKEITIYIIIAVILCIVILQLSLDSYLVPIILLVNIGFAIMFNFGTNIFLGQISYITKALVAVLQLGVTTDFSIFLYHSYEKKKEKYKTKSEAMSEAICETFSSITASSLTTIMGFLALCTMQLTLGFDLGIVMAKGVLLGVITVLTLFPSLLLVFDKYIEKTKHKNLLPNFNKFNKFIVKNYKIIFSIFLLLLIPAYLAYSKVDVYYKLDSSLPDTLESIKSNKRLKEDFNIVSTEMILVSKNMKNNELSNMINDINEVEGIDFVLSFEQLKKYGITENMLDKDLVKMLENEKYQMLLVNSDYDIATDELNIQIDKINKIVKKYDKHSIIAGEGPLMKDLVEISDVDFANVNIYSILCILIVMIIILKSNSVPLLLISTIEMAIFTNMGIAYFNGSVLPFIAPIVLGTIQLGATIDYAILLTTTYLSYRKKGKEKHDAMLEALNYCGTSIFISGLCFFAATFGVGLYSDIEMIGSICTLISRGALISMIVVITVLPSILLIFDKLIYKSKKERKFNMKKKVINLGLLILLILPISCYAVTKDEIVYSKINHNGKVTKTIVNEQLINDNNLKTIKDYTSLDNIINLSNEKKYKIDNHNISWPAYGNDILYQGTTTKNLPIDMNITYKLNGKKSSLNKIVGKKGNIDITIKYTNKEKHGDMYTPFIVTMGTIIDSENNSNIKVTNGKIINNGYQNIIIGISTPGLYESLDITSLKGLDEININFDTKSFELSSIYNIVTPKIIESKDLKVFNNIESIYSKVDSLQENMNLIDNSSQKIAEGSKKIKSGLSSSVNNLKNKSNALDENQVNYIEENVVAEILNTFNDEYLNNIKDSVWQEVKNELDTSEDQTIVTYVTSSVSKAVVEYLKDKGEYQAYINCQMGMMEDCQIISYDAVLPLITKAATTSATDVAENVTYYIAENVSKSVAENISKQTAVSVAKSVSNKVANEVANNVQKETINSLDTLYQNLVLLDDGINTLSEGISKYNNEGINNVSYLVNNTIKPKYNKLKQLVLLGESYSTFGSKLTNTKGNTKFIIVMDGKKIEKKAVVKEAHKSTSLWQKIKDLF